MIGSGPVSPLADGEVADICKGLRFVYPHQKTESSRALWPESLRKEKHHMRR